VHSFNVFQAEANDRHMQLRAETNFIRRQQGDFEKIWAEASAKLKAFDEKERQHFESIQEAILQTPPMDRIQYLRSLSKEQLLALSPLLDAFFGLDIKKMDQAIDEELGGPNQSQRAEKYGNEQIWYAPRAGQQSDWRSLFDVIESMNLQQGQMVVDLGSGIGRLGLLIGLLRPDVMFNGYEILQARVDAAEQASRALGFYGVSYVQANMSDSGWRPPYADHFYMFNPTNSETSEKLTMKLVELSNTHPFRIYLLTGFQSRSFRNYFQEIKRGHPSIYVRKGSN
jgi:1,2-phenylacetyl-CoA epoxidase PaaB subunit